MRILVVGAGAMGCLFSVRLKQAEHDVHLLEVVRERVEVINQRGIEMEGVSGQAHVRVPAYSEPPAVEPDLVLMCVKAYDTRKAGEGLRTFLGLGCKVLTLQNGLGNMEILRELFGPERVLSGVTAEGATLLGPGRIRHAGRGETIIQEGNGSDAVLSALRTAGFDVRAERAIQGFIWAKVIVNVGINALAAITRLKNGRLPELEGSRLIMEAAVSEALAVARDMGVSIPLPDPIEKVKEVCRSTSGNVASMLQDVIHGRLTEIAFINGAIAREGRMRGIPTPVNFTLASLVEVIQETYTERVSPST